MREDRETPARHPFFTHKAGCIWVILPFLLSPSRCLLMPAGAPAAMLDLKGNSGMEAGTQMEPGALLTTGPLCQPSTAPSGLLHERERQPALFSLVTWGVLLRAARPSVRASSLQSKTVPNMRGAAYPQDPFSECQLCSGGQLMFHCLILLHAVTLPPSNTRHSYLNCTPGISLDSLSNLPRAPRVGTISVLVRSQGPLGSRHSLIT